MADIMAEEPIRIRDCACPGSPHTDGDFVRLRPKLTAAGGAAANAITIYHRNDPVKANGMLAEVFMVAGIGWWNLTDEHKRPVSLNPDNIVDKIDWLGGGAIIFAETAKRYSEAVFGPEQPETPEADEDAAPLATSESSDSGPTAESTSATPPSSPRRPKPSK